MFIKFIFNILARKCSRKSPEFLLLSEALTKSKNNSGVAKLLFLLLANLQNPVFETIQEPLDNIPKNENVKVNEFVDNHSFQEQIDTLTREKEQLYKEISDLRSSLDRNRLELDSTRSDLEQHKARASKTLLEKEKLIAELKSNTTSGSDDVALMEMNQLR